MGNDPIVDEIHRLREEHAVRFHYDLHAICEDFRAAQSSSGRTVVSRPPRKPVVSIAPQATQAREPVASSASLTVG